MSEVLPYVGAAIGGFFGGPTGAQWGFAVGSFLGAVTAEKPHIQGPRLDDLQIVGTDYGQCIPYVLGSPRLSGQYIWSSGIREIANTKKQGKGGGAKQTTYTYECDVLIMLSENVSAGVARHWLNSELVANLSNVKEGMWQSITVYTGESGQMPDATYEAWAGVGRAPAYRGHTTIAIRGLQLGMSKQLPNLEHQTGGGPTTDPRIRLLTAFADASSEDQSLFHIGAGSRNGGALSDGYFRADYNSLSVNRLYYENAGLLATSVSGNTPVTYEVLLECAQFESTSSIEIIRIYKSEGTNPFVASVTAISASSPRVIEIVEEGPGQGGSSAIAYQGSTPITHLGRLHVALTVFGDNTASIWLNGQRIKNRVPFAVDTSGALGRVGVGGSEGLLQNAVIDYLGLRVSRAEVYTGASFTPPATLTGNLSNSGDDGLGPKPIPLDEALGKLLLRAGYTAGEFDIDSELDNVDVEGYAGPQVTPTRSHIDALRPLGLYESHCTDRLYIRPRAVNPSGTIPWGDLGASESPYDPADPFPLKMGNEVEVPAQIAVRYRNTASDWNTGTEFSDRQHSSLITTQTVDLGYGLTPPQAKRIADILLKDAMAGLGRATVRLAGRKHAKYAPGDVLTTTSPEGTTYRFRIVTKRDMVFMLEWEVALDDVAALVSDGVTSNDYVSIEEPAFVPPTEWEVIAIPPLMDADATAPGPYVAITPQLSATRVNDWPGAVFVRARLPEAYDQVFVSGDRAVMGECEGTLADFEHGSTVLDWTQTLTVLVYGELESAEFYDFFQDRTINAAIVGNEPIRFLRADFVEAVGAQSRYVLSGLLRGQLGQELTMGGHVAGESFVLLDGAIRRMVNTTSDIGQEQQVKAVTLNTLLSNVTDEDFTDDGIALRPYSPASLKALHQVVGDIDLNWVRRSRLVARYTDQGVFAPTGEAAEAYRVKIYSDPDGDPVRTALVTSPEWTYEAGDLAADGFTSGDPITITVQQLSESVGEGYAATIETIAP